MRHNFARREIARVWIDVADLRWSDDLPFLVTREILSRLALRVRAIRLAPASGSVSGFETRLTSEEVVYPGFAVRERLPRRRADAAGAMRINVEQQRHGIKYHHPLTLVVSLVQIVDSSTPIGSLN